METKTHVVFDRATSNSDVGDPKNAVDIGTDEVFYAKKDNEGPVEMECILIDPTNEEIDVLEIAFYKGKLRKTKFDVHYIDSDDKKHHIGEYRSTGDTSNYEKFVFPEKVKDIKSLVITFKGNDDMSPWFCVKGIRLCKHVEGTL